MKHGQKRIVTEKGWLLLAEKQKATYHLDPKCHYITSRGGRGVELSEQEVVDHMDLLRPCTVCGGVPKTKAVATLPPTIFPTKAMVAVWTCSDGREFYGDKGEKEALWYELELLRTRKGK